MKGIWKTKDRTGASASEHLRWPAGSFGCALADDEAANAWQPADRVSGSVVPADRVVPCSAAMVSA